jgi:hypothetical protein
VWSGVGVALVLKKKEWLVVCFVHLVWEASGDNNNMITLAKLSAEETISFKKWLF